MATSQNSEVDFFSDFDSVFGDSVNYSDQNAINELSTLLFRKLVQNSEHDNSLEDILKSPVDSQKSSDFVPLSIPSANKEISSENNNGESEQTDHCIIGVQNFAGSGKMCDDEDQRIHKEKMDTLGQKYGLVLDWNFIHRMCHKFLTSLPGKEEHTFSPEAMMYLQDCAEDVIIRTFMSANDQLKMTGRTVVTVKDFVDGMTWLNWSN